MSWRALYPILHKAEVCAGVQQVRGYRVLEGVEMPLALRDARELAVVLHEFIQSAAADGGGVAREEQRGDVASAFFQVGFQGFHVVGLQQVQSFEGVLEAVNPEPVLLHVEISGGQHPDFRGAQAVAVGKQKDGIVAFGVYGIEQAAGFILRQEINGGRCPALQTASEHCLRQCRTKPTVLDHRKPLDLHMLVLLL
jgi:hypothetical protein